MIYSVRLQSSSKTPKSNVQGNSVNILWWMKNSYKCVGTAFQESWASTSPPCESGLASAPTSGECWKDAMLILDLACKDRQCLCALLRGLTALQERPYREAWRISAGGKTQLSHHCQSTGNGSKVVLDQPCATS